MLVKTTPPEYVLKKLYDEACPQNFIYYEDKDLTLEDARELLETYGFPKEDIFFDSLKGRKIQVCFHKEEEGEGFSFVHYAYDRMLGVGSAAEMVKEAKELYESEFKNDKE